MGNEKFELMLDEAQANAALEKGMLYADAFVNKNYLINLDRYPLVELDEEEKSDEYIRLYQIERSSMMLTKMRTTNLLAFIVHSSIFKPRSLVIKSTRNALGFISVCVPLIILLLQKLFWKRASKVISQVARYKQSPKRRFKKY